MPAAPADPDPGTPAPRRTGRRRFWSPFVLGAVLVLGPAAGCVAWLLPDRRLAEDARAGGVGGALDEALRAGDAAPLNAHLRRAPDARVCFGDEWNSLRFSPLVSDRRTYGLPNLIVPDGHWALMVLRADRPPEFAVVPARRLILARGAPPPDPRSPASTPRACGSASAAAAGPVGRPPSAPSSNADAPDRIHPRPEAGRMDAAGFAGVAFGASAAACGKPPGDEGRGLSSRFVPLCYRPAHSVRCGREVYR